MSIVDKAKAAGAVQAVMGAAVGLMPDAPPDPLHRKGGVLGAQISRVDGPVKVAGQAMFAAEVKHGDPETALANAPVSVDLHYRTPRYSHAAIEPHALMTAWADDGSLVLHTCSQMLGGTRHNLSEVFGLKEDGIRVPSPFVGGGFGGKAMWSHEFIAVAAARLANRPVRLNLSREDVFRVTGFRTLTEQRMALGAREDGRLISLIHTGETASVSHNAFSEQISFPARHLYAADNLLVGQKKVDLDTVASTSMRAPGESVATFAIESAMDELAERLGMDPVELRIVNDADKDPESGHPFSSRHAIEAWRMGAQAFGWDHREGRPRARREGDWLIGMGCAGGTYPYQQMPGGAARIRLHADGRAVVQMAAHEMGMGTATVQVQHAAARLGLPIESVAFEYGDTDLPAGTMAGGSSQTVSIIAIVAAAADDLFKELIRLAGNDSPLAGLKVMRSRRMVAGCAAARTRRASRATPLFSPAPVATPWMRKASRRCRWRR